MRRPGCSRWEQFQGGGHVRIDNLHAVECSSVRLVLGSTQWSIRPLAASTLSQPFGCGAPTGRKWPSVRLQNATRLKLGMSRTLGLLGLELCQIGAFNQAAEGLEGEDFTSGCEEHFLHVFATNAKAAAGDARDDLVFLLPRRCPHEAELSQMLDAVGKRGGWQMLRTES